MEHPISHKSFPASSIAYAIGMLLVLLLIFLSPHANSQITSLLLLLGVGYLLFKRDNFRLYSTYLMVSIVVSKLLIYEFLSQNGTVYIGGGDDQIFNDLALYFTNHKVDINDPIYLAIPYKLYLYVLSGWIKIISVLSTDINDNTFHSALLMLNAFFGSVVAVTLKKILSSVGLYDKLSSYKYLLTIYNPFLLYYSSVLLREIFMVFFVVIALFALLSDMRIVYKIIIVLLCFTAAIFIRPVNSIVILLASLVYGMQIIKSNLVRFSIIGGIAGFILFYLVPNIGEILGRDVSSDAFGKFSELTLDQASDNSIGAILVGSKNPIVQMIVPVYVLFSPIPPPIVSEFTFRALLLSVGSVSWLITVILFLPFIIAFYKKRAEIKVSDIHYFRFVSICSVVCLLNVLMVGFSSHDPRHNLFVYPLIIPMALSSVDHSYFEKYKAYFFMLITGAVSLICFYIIFKLLS